MTLARERITNCADANQSWEQTSQVKGSLKKKKLQVCSIFCYINHHDKYSLKKKKVVHVATETGEIEHKPDDRNRSSGCIFDNEFQSIPPDNCFLSL